MLCDKMISRNAFYSIAFVQLQKKTHLSFSYDFLFFSDCCSSVNWTKGKRKRKSRELLIDGNSTNEWQSNDLKGIVNNWLQLWFSHFFGKQWQQPMTREGEEGKNGIKINGISINSEVLKMFTVVTIFKKP